MPLSQLPAPLDTLMTIAIAAGEAILEIHDGDLAVEKKADSSPVSAADRASEKLITEKLRDAFPDIPIVAEEACSEFGPPECGNRFFLVDPLDGTKEFLSGSGEFTVNIALVEDGRAVAGVVYAPVLGKFFCGLKQEAWRGEVERPSGKVADMQAIGIRPVPSRPIAVASRSHMSPETAAFLDRFEAAETRSIGSSLKFCLLAAGEADFYPRLGPTMQWDTAAGQAVLEAAGGQVLNLDGTPFLYGREHEGGPRPFQNPYFLAIGDPALTDTLIGNRAD
ncbi:3'(2'),5'-bisphosphate nucleotidase CysQ [Afifella marina]|uniref:3'(2'),5'-bisphosphate nucleotidase CysQ n=1 Tax=Afifella marina DSM 2698 TaxID=1120955 RepID=A0A1G5NZR1_AFIMA|nr:3'(2'),5'-bisphosphate nucleotidase CysQ [Afifella marina]MBK5916491.1 3'(2'),5'-bisphosphate nucleotidase [Afifella marina]SCZ42399.1 3'(2'), 5'-bisphosphate nucleotidase [Afifella marina DSM 2698]